VRAYSTFIARRGKHNQHRLALDELGTVFCIKCGIALSDQAAAIAWPEGEVGIVALIDPEMLGTIWVKSYEAWQ
jgi:hypothetical protein